MSAYQVNETNGHEWLSVVAGASRFNVVSKYYELYLVDFCCIENEKLIIVHFCHKYKLQ